MVYSTKGSGFVVLLLLFLCSALRLKRYDVKPRSGGALDCAGECSAARSWLLSAVPSSGICCGQSAVWGAHLLSDAFLTSPGDSKIEGLLTRSQ